MDQEKGLTLQKKIEALGIEVSNPFTKVVEVEYNRFVKEAKGKAVPPQSMVRPLVEGDLREIERCDGVVAMVTQHASVGTHMEVFYASRVLRRPVFVLYDFIFEGQSVHPWYAYLSKVFLEEDQLLAWLNLWSKYNDE